MSHNTLSSNALASEPEASLVPAGLKDYIAIARPDNWAKNVFMMPGCFLPSSFTGPPLIQRFC